VSCSILDKTR
jgi:hypothetical protein